MENQNEVWKDVLGFEGMYQVSNLGRVKSLDRIDSIGKRQYSRILKTAPSSKKYLNVVFCKNGKCKTHRVHRVVAIAFLDNPYNLPQINHIDSVRDNNKVDNLEFCSERENSCHRFKNKETTSKYTGVYFAKERNKWQSYIEVNKKLIRLGYFKNEIDAYNARCNYEKNNNIINKYL